MIYTSYFANIKNIKEDVCFISICGKAPEWYTGIQYKKLAPKYDFFMKWKETHDNDFYVERFDIEVLNTLNPIDVSKELYNISEGKDVVLLCYEKPTDFCHRHLVSQWFLDSGIDSMEYSLKEDELW